MSDCSFAYHPTACIGFPVWCRAQVEASLFLTRRESNHLFLLVWEGLSPLAAMKVCYVPVVALKGINFATGIVARFYSFFFFFRGGLQQYGE